MNQDQVKGKRDQIKVSTKKIWGELTDDDFKKAEGSADKLYGVIQEKFGDTEEAIKAKLDKLHLK
ncbi:MAG: CsbD family protein [Deltaproteobacteria bacterium]|nr:CsbD family protein [Deltaproteobacteria bacterium]